MDQLDALRKSGDDFLALTDTLDDADWAAASVCAGWNVDDLVRHVATGCRMAVVLASGAPAAEAAAARDETIEGPVTPVLREAIDQQLAALAAARPTGAVVHHPLVDMTVTQLIETRLVELVVHGLDLSRSVGKAIEIDRAVAEVAWSAMAPLADLTAALGVFGPGPSGEVGDGATATDRLLDVTGRRYQR
jgi:uncharacterized protein (TIGR03086 family)